MVGRRVYHVKNTICVQNKRNMILKKKIKKEIKKKNTQKRFYKISNKMQRMRIHLQFTPLNNKCEMKI